MKLDLENYIIEKVESGEFKPNQKLPTEMEFIELSGLSRMSVRRVTERLKEREVLYSVQGKGMFVSPFYKQAKIHKLTEVLGATSTRYLPSSSKIPSLFMKRFNKDFEMKEEDVITFVKLYFRGEEIIAYTLNWLNNADGKYNPNEVVNGKGKIFDEGDFNKVISTHKLEPTSNTDKNILLTESEFTPTTYSYYIKKDRNIVMMRVIKSKPKYFSAFETKNK